MNRSFKRGQVWFKNESMNTDSRVQSGSRPVLIFSSDDGNNTSDVVSVIPLTLEFKPDIEINVVFKGNGKRQTALCNMLGPCDKSKLTKYLFTVSDSVMERIEHGVLIANQMNYYITDNSGSDMFKLFSQFKLLVDGMVMQKFNELMSGALDRQNNEIENLKRQLSQLSQDVSRGQTTKEVSSKPIHHTESVGVNMMKNALELAGFNAYSDTKESRKVEEVKQPKTRSTRKVWDVNTCKEFVSDKLKLTSSEMMKKYNLSNSVKVSQYYSYCRTKLNKLGIDYEGK